MVKMVGRGHKDSSRIYLQLPGLVADACLRTGDDGTRGYIAVVRAVEEENLFSVGHRQEICDRIYGKTNHVAEPGFRTFDDAKWRNVSVRVPREYPNTPPRHTPDQNFSMVQIQIHRVGRDELCARPLNHPHWSFRAIGSRSKYEDRVRQGIRNYDLVMSKIVGDSVDCPPQLCRLAGDHSPGLYISVRHPGERRDSRLGHSIRHQDLFSLAIVGHRHRIPESCAGRTRGG